MISNQILCTDALSGLRALPEGSIDCVMTSPPYWSLRDYGIPPALWPDGTRAVLGLEESFADYIEHLCSVFDEVRRVMKSTGTLWINLGDTYAGSWGNYVPFGASGSDRAKFAARGHLSPNARPPSSNAQTVPNKSLCLIPERFMLAMVERGWILRNRIVWHKPNHMPSSVKDRFASSWEHLLFFTKSPKYFFDLNAVRLPHKAAIKALGAPATLRASPSPGGGRLPPRASEPGGLHPVGKNPSDFWAFSPETRSKGALVGSSGIARVPHGQGWVGHPIGGAARILRENDPRWLSPDGKNPGDVVSIATRASRQAHVAVYPEALCERPIKAGCPVGGIVLDPFLGSGTTAVVAKRLGRRYLGFEVKPEYVALALARLESVESNADTTHHEQLKGGGGQPKNSGTKAA